ncbi:hypothetical protein HC028_24870 [Planosporangium flavigriseum]|uniref:Chitosanase of glycosyl hydrolase group 75 n=1 Tax=Planosporangium flavigriseum TaxID=373681 RepID=A0A8J3PMQ7_9ACTN|nr:glycoside hydrolase family 75 protein [Planosporangium flavigriseum]NJC67713.1 hypothetical protein [Planosporangium flavigriseum]GIG75811.1 hypothetical protein Pfl04_42150 [Planosporangium flavigriseum]
MRILHLTFIALIIASSSFVALEPVTLAWATADQLLARTQPCDAVSTGRYTTHDNPTARVPVCRSGPAYFWHAGMSIDCDGVATPRCNAGTDPAYQALTLYRGADGRYLTADEARYFVIPLPSSRFDYRSAGIAPGNVGAIVYDGKVVYGIFADVGPETAIGEASYATAVALGINPDPGHGGVSGGVTYVVFPGQFPDDTGTSAINQVGAAAAAAFVRG